MESPELEAFVDCAKGSVDKSKTSYLKLLPLTYEVILELSTEETGCVRVVSFTFDGCSAAQGAATVGMTFIYVDINWILRSLPLCFVVSKEISKPLIRINQSFVLLFGIMKDWMIIFSYSL